MPYYHARVNACRVGVTHTGLANHPIVFSIGGVQHYPKVDGFSIVSALDGSPSTCTFTLQQATAPTRFADVTITLGGSLIWGGTLTETRTVAQRFASGAVFHECQAIDWTWLMDRYARVTLEVGQTSVNTLVSTILGSYTNGGFSTGYISGTLSAVGPMSFQGETVSSAIRRVASAASAYVRIRPTKSVDVFQSLPASNALTISNSSEIRNVAYEASGSQIRTRAYYVGGGGATTALVSAGAATVPVDECGWYSGTKAQAGGSVFTYSGRSASSGPGNLTGCSGITYDIPEGGQVQVVAQADDATAQTNLATALGGGRSGIAVAWFADDRLSQTEVTARASADLTFYKSEIPTLSYVTTARYHEPGKIVSATVTSPISFSGDFRIQRVTTRPYGKMVGDDPSYLESQVECRLGRRSDILDIVVGAA